MHTAPLAYISEIEGKADIIRADNNTVVLSTDGEPKLVKEAIPYLNKLFTFPEEFLTVGDLGANGDSALIEGGLDNFVGIGLLVKDGDAFRAPTSEMIQSYLVNFRGR